MARWKALPEIIAKRQPARSRTGKSQGPGPALVAIEVTVNSCLEIHYVFPGSEWEKFWNAKKDETAIAGFLDICRQEL